MKILFITHVNSMSGANRSLFQLIKELKEGYGVTAVVLAPESDKKAGTIHGALKDIGVPVVEAPIWYFKLEKPTFRNILGYIRYLWRSRHLPQKFQRYQFDIIHSNTSVVDIGAYISRKLKVKHVWHIREFGDLDYNLKPIGGSCYERYTYRHADAFIAISKAVAMYYKKRIPTNITYTIYNGIYLPMDIPKAVHNKQIVQFLCAGFISRGKNQMEIAKAVNELVNEYRVKHPFHVTLVGIHSQPYTEELISYISDKKIGSYFEVLEEVDGIQSLAATMDVGIVPSKAEAFGRVTIEYQLQNLLVIANDSGANPELIEDNVTGLLYQAGNYYALAEKMLWVLDNYKKIESISKTGMEHARENFQSERNTKKIFELYSQLISTD